MPYETKETLCWKCKRPGTRTCSWDSSCGNIPVDGWVATDAKHRASRGGYIKTYHVIECPMFILDEDYVERTKHAFELERRKQIEEIENLIHYGWTDKAISLRFGVSIDYVRKRRYKWREKQAKKKQKNGGEKK